jgi:hypothetical protein
MRQGGRAKWRNLVMSRQGLRSAQRREPSPPSWSWGAAPLLLNEGHAPLVPWHLHEAAKRSITSIRALYSEYRTGGCDVASQTAVMPCGQPNALCTHSFFSRFTPAYVLPAAAQSAATRNLVHTTPGSARAGGPRLAAAPARFHLPPDQGRPRSRLRTLLLPSACCWGSIRVASGSSDGTGQSGVQLASGYRWPLLPGLPLIPAERGPNNRAHLLWDPPPKSPALLVCPPPWLSLLKPPYIQRRHHRLVRK